MREKHIPQKLWSFHHGHNWAKGTQMREAEKPAQDG